MTLMENDSRFQNRHQNDFHINFDLNLNLSSPKKVNVAQQIFQMANIASTKQNHEVNEADIQNNIASNIQPQNIKYGELILLGYNGSLHDGDKGRKRSKFEMLARAPGSANGVSFRARRKLVTPGGPGVVPKVDETVRTLMTDPGTYAVAYTFNDVAGTGATSSLVVLDEYGLDLNLDMYQVGRSPEKPIDFVVLDTLRSSPPTTASPTNPTDLHQNPGANGDNNGNNNHHSHHHHHHRHHHQPTTPQGMKEKDHSSASVAPTPPVKTIPSSTVLTESTISRFACRFTVQRDEPYTVKVYAAGFDTSNNIFLGPKAVKWRKGDDLFDGLTTNGVLISHPTSSPSPLIDKTEGEESSAAPPNRVPLPPQKWYEVSVEGRLYTLRLPQSMNTCGTLNEAQDNVLKDWTLIDICGATLLFRTADSLNESPNSRTIEGYVEQINSCKPQCPVRLSTLIVPRKSTVPATASPHHNSDNKKYNGDRGNPSYGCNSAGHVDNRAYVYLKCGHVQGLHQWGKEGFNNRKCPICQKIGPFAALYPGNESAFYVDFGPLTHAFDPCGHMTNEITARYWSSITIPSAEFKRICPFCATELSDQGPNPGFIKLHFQAEN